MKNMRNIIIGILSILLIGLSAKAQRPFIWFENGEYEIATADDLKDILFLGLQEDMKQVSQQCPIPIDDLTEMTSAILIGNTIHYNYKAYLDSDDLTKEEVNNFCNESKSVILHNILFLFERGSEHMPVEEWSRLFKELGITYNHNFKDINGKSWAKIVIDFNDFNIDTIKRNSSKSHKYNYNTGDSKEELTAEDLREFVISNIRKNVKELNEQLPVQVDEVTTLYSAIVNGTAINYNYKVWFERELFAEEDIEELREDVIQRGKENMLYLMKQNSDKMPIEEWIKLFNELGIQYHYNYQDINGKMITKIIVDFKDF